MKYLHLTSLLFFLGNAFAQDSVDQLAKKYTDQAQEGLIRLHTRHREELVKIQNAAMGLKDLALANKANAKIKELDDEIRRLGGTPSEPKPSVTPLIPIQLDTQFYGKWQFTAAKWSGIKELRDNGVCYLGEKRQGRWNRTDKHLIIKFDGGEIYTLDLPIKEGILSGVSSYGSTIKAVKIQPTP